MMEIVILLSKNLSPKSNKSTLYSFTDILSLLLTGGTSPGVD